MLRRIIELTLIEVIVCLLLWFWNSFLAFYFTLSLTVICFAILIISLLAEWLERSKVSNFYFYIMAISVIVPWVVAAIVIFVLDLDVNILE